MKLKALKQRASSIKRNIYALYKVTGDPRVPLLPKLIIIGVIGYAVSPVDLIPDFIPVLGYLDDIVLLPLGIWLAVKLVPSGIWEEYCLKYKDGSSPEIPRNRWAAVVIVAIWCILLVSCIIYLKDFIKNK
ncbi:MAG: YkvA family protein [Desulfobacteraceae bacterium]|jgi:uncharacterized membrane protein YkvA (DUF1232 family)